MKHKFFTLTLALLGSLLLAATAQATSCGGIEFALVAQNNVGFENGPTVINGNVLVTSATGTAKVGNFVTINGALYAANISIGNDATVAECHGNVTGNTGACGAIFPFDPPAECLSAFPPPPLAAPVVDSCVDAAANQTFSAANNNTATNDLASGCYRSLRLNAGAIVNLTGPGEYRFRDIRLLGGSELKSSVANTERTVNVNGLVVTEPNTKFTDLLINSAGSIGAVVALGNNTTLTRTTINAPFGNIHPRTGSQLLECSELVGKTLTIQPIFAECVSPGDIVCECPPGTQFEVEVCAPGVDCEQARRCVPVN